MPVLLEPVALIWRLVTWLRWKLAKPYRSRLPVVCVGNLTAGGGGKTPAAIAIAEFLKSQGESPVFLTRGHGGRVTKPHRVDIRKDVARDVGDEPLLLAKVAPTVVSPDRAEGARLCETLKAGVIVMDDGFQNPSLEKDLSIVMVDRASGIGNGLIIPAGPLRAAVATQLRRAHALVFAGHGGGGDDIAARARTQGLPVFSAVFKPTGSASKLRETRVIAFTGIAHPEKFFRSLEEAGVKTAEKIAFPDHHAYSEKDAARLLAAATKAKASLVTTEKDWVRLQGSDKAFEALRAKTKPFPVVLEFQDRDEISRLLKQALAARRQAN